MRIKHTLLLGFCALVLWPVLAAGHTRLVRSEPAAAAVLANAPPALILEFSAPPEAGFSQVQLRTGREWKTLPVSQQDRRIEARLLELKAGTHQVRWSVTSRDGHRLNGQLSFTIR